MAHTVQNPTRPTILVTGRRVLADGSEVDVTNYDINNELLHGSPLHYKKKDPFVFRGDVTVTLTSTVYPLRGYAHYVETATRFVGRFEDTQDSQARAEIHYSVNGSAPLREGLRLYKKAFTLSHNGSNDQYKVRAKLVHYGQWSDITQCVIIVRAA